MTNDVRTINAKYVFLDIVGFTHNRSVEAQSDLVRSLNEIVAASLYAVVGRISDQLVLLPTGDGICIVLLSLYEPVDVHLQVALEILQRVASHNESTTDKMRQFTLRIGVNENVDNLVTDINGNRNLAGAGISMAQRVMTFADGNQIFVGPTVYETLRQRERYLEAFRPFRNEIKHGITLTAYQYIAEGHAGLVTTAPTAFTPKVPTPTLLPRLVSYYIAYAIVNRPTFLAHRGGAEHYAGIILLWFLAKDAIEAEETPSFEEPRKMAPDGDTTEKQLLTLAKNDFEVLANYSSTIEQVLRPYAECFEWGKYSREFLFVNDRGRERLETEAPDIWEKFNLSWTSAADQTA